MLWIDGMRFLKKKNYLLIDLNTTERLGKEKMVKICRIGEGPTMAVIAFNCPSIDIDVVDILKSRIVEWNNNRLSYL